MASTSQSVALAVAHAVTFLTQKLASSYSPNTLLKLQTVLEANLIAHCTPSWVVKDPIKGSGRRCMTLSPTCLPPRPIWTACAAANVQWFDWIAMLGNKEFDLFIDPGCVAARIDNQVRTIWSDAVMPAITPKASQPVFSEPMLQAQRKGTKTFAQQVVEADQDDDDQIFALLAGEISSPTWMTPVLAQFPMPARSSSPLSSISEHSRCSSRSSNSSSSAFSFTSADTSSSHTSMSSASLKSHENKQSRRERARSARVFVDTTKTEVTPYDGGKTTVLTGGVMLGGGLKAAKPKMMAVTNAIPSSNGWRSVRA